MKRRLPSALPILGALLIGSTDAGAQPLPPGHPAVASSGAAQATAPPQQKLPPGHPPTDRTLPPGHPPTGEALPPGHPATPATEANAAADSAMAMRDEPPPDTVARAPDLPPGSVEVTIRDERNSPAPNFPIELTISKHDIAEGDSSERRSAQTDAQGRVVFGSLPSSTDYSFRVEARRGPATFSSDSLQLTTGAQRVVLHTYPSTSDIRQALVGLRGIVVVQPREDVFRFEANFEVFNIGRVAWVPDGWSLSLPEGAKAFQAAEGDTRFEKKDESNVRLTGTFGPGRHEVGYSFQLTNDHATERTFSVPLPPHIAELRVVAEAAKGMKFDVEGFSDPQRVRAQSGSWMLVTGRQLVRGESPLKAVTLTLSGLPAPSPGRWYALVAAAVLMAVGISGALRSGDDAAGSGKTADDTKRARRLLLDELVVLERSYGEKQIGPRTYEASRQALLDALARLEAADVSGARQGIDSAAAAHGS